MTNRYDDAAVAAVYDERLAMNDIVFENTWPADAQPTPTAY